MKERERVCVRERECVCVRERVRQRETERERDSEREKKRNCVCEREIGNRLFFSFLSPLKNRRHCHFVRVTLCFCLFNCSSPTLAD